MSPPAAPPPELHAGAYVELFYAWNFDEPDDGVTNLRAFDDRHASFVLQNAELEATWTHGAVSGRVALQAGEAPDGYYQAEPAQPATGSAPARGPDEFRHIQEAYFAWATPCQVELAGGLFLSPIGPETVAEHLVWNWSRSNLFFALPYYHTGVRAKRAIGDTGWTAIAAVYNGWNSAIDDNDSPSLDAIAAYAHGAWSAQLQYFGGVERARGAPEGSPWRHLVDAYIQGPLGGGLTFMVQANGGLERGALGTSSWLAGAAYLKYDVARTVYLAARGDAFREWEPAGAQPIFLPVSWVASGTLTVSWQPSDGLALRLEARHDRAGAAAYFGGAATTPNRRAQDTLTAGMTAWF